MRSHYKQMVIAQALLAMSAAATVDNDGARYWTTASREPFSVGDVIKVPDKRGEWIIEAVMGLDDKILRCRQARPNGRWRYCDVPLAVAKRWSQP